MEGPTLHLLLQGGVLGLQPHNLPVGGAGGGAGGGAALCSSSSSLLQALVLLLQLLDLRAQLERKRPGLQQVEEGKRREEGGEESTLESSVISVLFCSRKSSSWLCSFPWSISVSLSSASTSCRGSSEPLATVSNG